MNFRNRFIAVVLVNSLLFLGLLVFMTTTGWDTSKRLIDLNLENRQDLFMLAIYVSALLISLIANVILLSSRKNHVKFTDMERILRATHVSS